MKKKLTKKQAWKNNWFFIKLAYKSSPSYMIMLTYDAFEWKFLVFLEHIFGINFILETVEYGRPFSDALKFLIFIIGCWCISFVRSSYYHNVLEVKGKLIINQKLNEMLYKKAKEIDLECYDNPEYYNDFILSLSEAEASMERTQNIVYQFVCALTMIISAGAFFLFKDKLSVIFVFASFVLTFYISKMLNKLNFKIRLQENVLTRKREYIHRVFYLNDYAKEIRLNQKISGNLHDEFKSTNKKLYQIQKEYGKKRMLLQLGKGYFANDFITDCLFVIYLLFRAAVQHAISYSSVVVLFNSVGDLKYSLRSLADVFPMIGENSLYIDKILDFMKNESKIKSESNLEVPRKSSVLELKNVSFSYNSKDGYILKDINLTIQPNEKIAIVGYNGAGKTTLIKLIMRLYDPSMGKVSFDGVDIKDYNLVQYRDSIGTVFQDYKLYAATVKENVLLDDIDHNEEVDKNVYHAINLSGLRERLDTLENGLDTELTGEFSETGVNLSGGEAQKLAISRGLYHDANIIVLDEPSSALDPIAEYHLNHTMLKAADHKTILFISHRLSTTRKADRIIMLENGRIIEEGRHEDLLKMNGKYAMMWKVQSEQYQN